MKSIFALALAGMFLVGCERNPVDRLLGMEENNSNTPNAVQPASPEAAPLPDQALPRFQTFRFEGVVKPEGTAYYGSLTPGDPVSGTFTIDFEGPRVHKTGSMSVYKALSRIDGTVGGLPFGGEDNLMYVRSGHTVPYWADTGLMKLDGKDVNFDFFFVLTEGNLPDDALSQLRGIEGRSYANIDLWFETIPMEGRGFNCKINTLQKIDPPLTVASAR